MSRKRPIHPLVQLLVTLSLLVLPLLAALPVSAGGAVDLWISSATDNPDPVRAGQTLTYTFVVNGTTVGIGAFLEDVRLYVYLPPWVTPTGVSNRPYSLLPDGSVLFDLGSYPVGSGIPGGGATCQFQVRVADDAVAQVGGPFDLVTTAWVTSDNENRMTSGPDQATVVTSVGERADLQVVKVRVPDLIPNFIIAGQTILYEVTVRNTGPSAARNVILYDWAVEGDPNYDLELLSSSVTCQTLVGAAGSGRFQVTGLPAGSGGEDVYACPLGTVGADEERTYQFLYRVPSGMSVASNDIVNFAQVLSTNKLIPIAPGDLATPDPDVPPFTWPLSLAQVRTGAWDNMAATADTNVWAEADISVTKTAWPDPVIAGQKVWYQVTVTNNGPSDAATVTVTDTLPVDVTYIANDDACVLSAVPGPNGEQQVVCTVTSLKAGESATFVIEGYVDPAAYFNQLPPPPGEEPKLTNKACAAIQEIWIGNEPVYIDPDWSNNCSTIYTFLDELADLRLIKISKPDDVVRAGETFTYTIIVDNYGPSAARNVVITDTLLNSSLVTIQSCAFSVSQGGGNITQFVCTTGPVVSTQFGTDVGTFATNYLDPRSPTSQGRLRASFRLVANEAVDVDNFATVVAETPDPDRSNNEAWDAISVMAVADLSVTKTAVEPTVTAGEEASWTIVVANNGPSTAENVVLTDWLPGALVNGSIYVDGAPGGCTYGTPGDPTNPLVCNLGTMAPTQVITLTLYGDVNPAFVANQPKTATSLFIDNNVMVYSDTFDADNSNNIATDDVAVEASADLSVAKFAIGQPIAGQIIHYEIQVRNSGPSVAESVILRDYLPSEVHFLSASVLMPGMLGEVPLACTLTPGSNVLLCPLGDLEPTGSMSILAFINVLIDPATPDGATLVNDADVNLRDTFDPDTSNNTASRVVDVSTVANLVATKASVPQKVVAGEQVKYVITVTNPGPSDAQNVLVVDHFGDWPDELHFEISSDSRCQLDPNGHISCGIGTLPAGATWSADIWATVDPAVFPGTVLTDRVAVRSDTPPYVYEPDNPLWVTTETYVLNAADLKVQKFGKPDGEVRAGEYLTYTIIVDNLGPSWAWTPTVQDMLRSDGEFTLVSITSSRPNFTVCDVVPPVTSTDGAIDFACYLAAEGPVALETLGRWVLTVVVTADETQDINNTVRVFSPYGMDPDTSNNYAAVEHDITDVADLSVVKTEMGYAYIGDGQFEVVPAKDAVIAGYEGGLTYTMVIRNDGPSTAENVVLQDRLPAWVIVTGYEATQGACNTGTPGSAQDKMTCGLGTIVPGGVVTVTVYGYVPHWIPEGTILENDALVYSDIFDPDNSDNLATNLTTVWTYADLEVWKVGPSAINAGEEIEYQITVINDGVSTAKEVVLEDQLPAEVTYRSYRVLYGNVTCSVAGGGMLCALGDMAPGQVVLLAVVGQVDPGFSGVITNTVLVWSEGGTVDPYPVDNGAVKVTDVSLLADLQVTKVDRPDPAVAGEMLYYTLKVTNNGPSNATVVWLEDTLPAEVTFVDATEGGVYDANAHSVAWFLGDIPVGTSKTVEVHVQVNTDARIVMVGPLANTAIVKGNEADPDQANNVYVEETFVNDLADLRVTKVGKPDGEVRAGEPLYYTIYVDNLGPSDARDVVVTDNILSNLEFRVTDITTSQGITRTEDGVLYFELGILPAGERATMTMIVTADETQDVNNIVSVYATTPDPDYSNNQAIVMTAITDVSDLGITKEIVGGDLIAGTNVIYEIVVWNDGPSTAENVVVKDWLPAGTVPVGEPQGLPAGAQYTFGIPGNPTAPAIVNLGTLVPGARYTVTLELAIDQAYGPNLLANDVEISSDIFDPENGNNRASAVFQVEEWSNLYVLKWDTPDPVMAGTTVEYFIGVQNFGPSAARNVKVFDWITGAEWLTLKEYKIGNGSGYCLSNQTFATVDCYLGDIAAGAWREIYLTFEVSPDAPDGTMVFDGLEIFADSPIEIVDSDLEEETTIVNVADLEVTKSVSPAPVAYTGEGVAYEVTVTNLGPGTAFGVVVTDTLPSGMSFIVASGLCDFAAGGTLLPPTPGGTPFVCNLGNVAVGQSLTFVIYAKVDPDAEPGIYTNVVEVTTDASTDPNMENNVATAQVEVKGKADLKVLKFGKPEGDVWAGTPLTYTIIVDNLGPGDAQGVMLKELLRASGEFDLVSVSSDRDIDSTAWSGTFSGDFEFEIYLEDPLEVGGRWLVEIVVEADETQDINNCVTVVSDYVDPDPANNDSCAAHAITDRADLAIYKMAEGYIPEGCEWDLDGDIAPGANFPRGNDNGGGWYENQVAAGSWLWYGLWVENEGPSTAENVVAVDYLPLGLIYRGAWYWVEEDGEWYEADCFVNQALDRVTCNLGSLAPGEGKEIWIALDVPSWMPEGTELWNTARVFSDIYDHNNANDVANNLTVVHAVADIAVTKESVPETALPWQEISYVITVENLGPSDAPGTLVHDMIPYEVSGVIWSAEFFGGATGKASGNWAIHEVVNLPAGSKVVYTVHGMLDTYWPITNTVEVMLAQNVWDPCEENNSATDVNAPKLNFLPILMKKTTKVVELPNLVVDRIVATQTGIQVDVRNIGDAPVYQGFWVDLYLNPPATPTRVNQIWNDPEGDGTYCDFPICQGLAWGVTGNVLPLNPGDLLILRVDDSYPKIAWPLNAGDIVYAQVDSWNPETDYGTVIESHEAYGGPYDNIRWATRVLYRLSDGAGHAAIAGQGVSFSGLPPRP